MTIVEEIAVERAVKAHLGIETESEFQRIYERERKANREMLHVLLDIRKLRA